MNKTLKIVAAVAVLVILGSVVWFVTHDFNKDNLRDAVAAKSNILPYDKGPSGILQNISYDADADNLTCEWLINEAYLNLDALRDSTENNYNIVAITFQDQDDRRFLKDIVEAKASLTYVLKSPTHGESQTIQLSAEQLADLYKAPLLDKAQINAIVLANQIVADGARMPMQWTDGATLTDKRLEGENLVYVIQTATPAKFNELKTYSNLNKVVKGEFKERRRGSADEKALVDRLESLGYGVVYKYTSPAGGDTLAVEITPQEIHNISQLR